MRQRLTLWGLPPLWEGRAQILWHVAFGPPTRAVTVPLSRATDEPVASVAARLARVAAELAPGGLSAPTIAGARRLPPRIRSDAEIAARFERLASPDWRRAAGVRLTALADRFAEDDFDLDGDEDFEVCIFASQLLRQVETVAEIDLARADAESPHSRLDDADDARVTDFLLYSGGSTLDGKIDDWKRLTDDPSVGVGEPEWVAFLVSRGVYETIAVGLSPAGGAVLREAIAPHDANFIARTAPSRYPLSYGSWRPEGWWYTRLPLDDDGTFQRYVVGESDDDVTRRR